MNHDDEILHRCADGVASPDEQAALANRLSQDAGLRGRYLDLMNLDSALAAAGAAVDMTAGGTTKAVRRAWVNPLAAAAAGLVIGLFGATAVWAVAAGKGSRAVKVALADAGFETDTPIPSSSVPREPGHWSGDPCAFVEAQGRVQPREGRRMLKVLAASNTGDFVGSKNMAADLWQVIVLPGSGLRTVGIRAWFNADTKNQEKQARFALAAVAGNDAATSAKELWDQRSNDDTPLPFARTTMAVDHDPATWEAGELTLQVPPQARVLVIGIAAFRLANEPPEGWFPGQFVDDVSVSVTEEVQP
jgi:hypothetical protein